MSVISISVTSVFTNPRTRIREELLANLCWDWRSWNIFTWLMTLQTAASDSHLFSPTQSLTAVIHFSRINADAALNVCCCCSNF